MNSLRIFFAIVLPKSIQDLLSEYQISLEHFFGEKNVQWTKACNLHVTLQFMKSVPIEHISQLIDATTIQAQQIPPFKLELDVLELFPSPTHPRFIVFSAGPHNKLTQLVDSIGLSISALGYPLEQRAFRGHLTLGRLLHFNSSSDTLKNLPALKTPRILITEFQLLESKSSQGRSNYHPLGRFKLGKKPK